MGRVAFLVLLLWLATVTAGMTLWLTPKPQTQTPLTLSLSSSVLMFEGPKGKWVSINIDTIYDLILFTRTVIVVMPIVFGVLGIILLARNIDVWPRRL